MNNDLIPLPQLPVELAEHSGSKISYERLYRLALSGEIPVFRMGSRLYLRRDRLAETSEILGLTSSPPDLCVA